MRFIFRKCGIVWNVFIMANKLSKKQPYVSVLSIHLTISFIFKIYQNIDAFSAVTEKHNFCLKLSNVVVILIWVSMQKLYLSKDYKWPKNVKSFQRIFGRIWKAWCKGFLKIYYSILRLLLFICLLLCVYNDSYPYIKHFNNIPSYKFI